MKEYYDLFDISNNIRKWVSEKSGKKIEGNETSNEIISGTSMTYGIVNDFLLYCSYHLFLANLLGNKSYLRVTIDNIKNYCKSHNHNKSEINQLLNMVRSLKEIKF